MVAAEDVAFPNGTVITPDGRTLILGESMGRRLTAFTIAAPGQLTERRVFADLPGRTPSRWHLPRHRWRGMGSIAHGERVPAPRGRGPGHP